VTKDQFTGYLELLEIRQAAFHRNVIIAGGLFLFSILSTVGFGLLTGWSGRSTYIMGGFDVLLIVNFIMAWSRLEIVKGNIELMNNLQRIGVGSRLRNNS
jgi:hypothetical protein